VIPETAGALLALFGLVAPGLVYEARRERRRPALVESTLREAGRVALTSLIFTVLSLALMVWWAANWTRLPDIGDWLAGGKSFAVRNYQAVAAFALLELALACLFAVIAEAITGAHIKGDITASSTWYASLDLDQPPHTARTWLRVATTDGTQFKGALRWYSPGATDERDLVLGGLGLQRLPAGRDPEDEANWVLMTGWNQVIIPGDDIKYVMVTYLNEYGEILRYSARSRWLQTAMKRLRGGRDGSVENSSSLHSGTNAAPIREINDYRGTPHLSLEVYRNGD
jgi:hypothetical protein